MKQTPIDPILTQVFTGHGGFSEYLHRFKCKESPACIYNPTERHDPVLHPGVTTRIYTDGSKQDGRVGAALVIYSPNNDTKVKKYKLHDTCSVYQAELLAIAEACSWIDQHHIPDTTIFTDSMSATQEISNPNSTNPFVVHIHKMYRQAIKHSRKITFVWVKAHVGIDGNEAADVAAKAAAHSHAAYKHTQFPISLIRYMAKQNSRLESDTTYATGEKGQYTRNLLPNTDAINKLRAAIEIDFPWTQVLTGHGYCRQYLHRFKISDTDKCPCDPHYPNFCTPYTKMPPLRRFQA
ncbi:uncharacterized protein LOC119193537 [Manduca sexta]|uniref:uncharacterized protein LOC119193537 n=1 Tax=Manduca sexta TaxID=7130 RepID=UPI00188FE705|nr:uncharacterized protein LOC119193537 [Manduca sexta]